MTADPTAGERHTCDSIRHEEGCAACHPATPDAGDASTSASGPLSEDEFNGYGDLAGRIAWDRKVFTEDDVLAIVAAREAKARAEGHREGYETARGDFVSGAFIGGPTYEALRDSFTGQRIVTEARAEAGKQIAQAIEAEARAAHEVADESGVHYDHAASIAREVTDAAE